MPAQFPRENEGQWTFSHTAPGASGDVATVLGFALAIPDLYDQGMNDDISGWWGEFVVAQMCSQLTYTGLHTLVGRSFGVQQWDTVESTDGGLTGNQMLPLNNAVVVKKSTGLAGKRFRGRLYFPGIPEDAVDDAGLVLGSYIDDIVAALAQFQSSVTGLTSVDIDIAVLHRDISVPAKPAYTLSAIDATPVIGWSADTVLGSQRTRLRD